MIYSIHTTCPSEKEAETIAKTLLEQKLIACANIFPVRSLYILDNKLNDEAEFILLVKTSKFNKEKAIQCIKQLHSYDIPCILAKQVESNAEYENWVNDQL